MGMLEIEAGKEQRKTECGPETGLKPRGYEGSPQAGTEVSMQYHNEIWEGYILSVHGEQFCQRL